MVKSKNEANQKYISKKLFLEEESAKVTVKL